MKINQESRNLILFMLLGDGYLNKQGYLRIIHSSKQKDYLEWKRNLLIKYGISVSDIKYQNNNGYDAYVFTTKTYKFLRLYRKILYRPKKIIYNKKLLSKINPLALAIWYMDDGGLSQKKKNGKIHANDLLLNTHLHKKENQIIIDYFKKIWNIQFTQIKNRGLYRLRCGTCEARKFIKIVEPYVSQIPSMRHKINIKQ